MADIGKTVGIIFKAQDQASGVVDKLAGNMERVEKSTRAAAGAGDLWQDSAGKWRNSAGQFATEAEKAASGVERLGEKAGASSKNLSVMTDAMRALAASLVVKAFIDANVEVERFTLGMTQVTGSADGAKRELEYVRGVAMRLGIDVADAAQAWLGMAAATKGTALEGEGARAIFEAVSGQFKLLGRSSADVAGALVQVQQGISKGKFELEDLKSIAERMPGFFDQFAKSLGKTTPELFDLISAGKIGGAEFLKFAESINAGIKGLTIEGFEASMSRLRNAVSDAFVMIGQAGVFDALIKGVDVATASIVGATASFRLMGEVVGIVAGALSSRNFSGVGEAVDEAMTRAANSTRGARDAMLGWKSEAAPTAAAAAQVATETVKVADSAAAVSGALKTLGVDSKKVNADLIGAFETIATSAAVTAKEISAGLGSAIKSATNIQELDRLGSALTQAYVNGRISAEEFGNEIVRLGEAQQKILDPTDKASKALAEQTKEAQRAKEATEKMALELEKLASNERIKFMEFKAQIDVARIQADAEKVTAAFQSINTGIESTGDVLGNLFGMFDKLGSLDSTAYRAIFDQINKENGLREQSFNLQKQLTEAQIENMRAQTDRMRSGDALIKIDGAGLKPHLEAFMWEILRTIQMRVNRDGLQMLLGVNP